METETKVPLCAVHQRLEDSGKLKVAIGSFGCVACSLHERTMLLDILAPFAPADQSEDSLAVLRRLAEFYITHNGENRVVVSYPAPTPPEDVFTTTLKLAIEIAKVSRLNSCWSAREDDVANQMRNRIIGDLRWVLEGKVPHTNPRVAEVAENVTNALGDLHVAACQAVSLMNGELQTGGNAQAHTILREALVKYADAVQK